MPCLDVRPALASSLASPLLLTACEAPVDDDAVVIGNLNIRNVVEGSIVVRYLAEYAGNIVIAPEKVDLDDARWLLAVGIRVNGVDFELEKCGVFVSPDASDDPGYRGWNACAVGEALRCAVITLGRSGRRRERCPTINSRSARRSQTGACAMIRLDGKTIER